MQPQALWLGRVPDFDTTACLVAWSRSGTRRNGIHSGFGGFWNSTKRHAWAFPGVPERDETTCSGVSLRSRSRGIDTPCQLLVFWNSMEPHRAIWHVLKPDATTCRVTCSCSGSHSGRSMPRVCSGLASYARDRPNVKGSPPEPTEASTILATPVNESKPKKRGFSKPILATNAAPTLTDHVVDAVALAAAIRIFKTRVIGCVAEVLATARSVAQALTR